MSTALSYVERNSVIHHMTGTTKLFFFLFWSIAAMVTYDTRILVGMFLFGCILFKISKLKWKEISFALIFMFTLMAINIVGIYIFAPEQGVEIYGTRHVVAELFWRYSITLEQLFYMFNFLMKYMAVIPIALLFIMTTNPSEFAASMNKIGISYRVGYAVAIALRYIPDIQRDYREISQAQQARGISLGKDEKTLDRIKNSAAILFPLVLSSIQRIETISNAMELRGFGKHKKRTWIMARPMAKRDYIGIVISIAILTLSVAMIIVNGGRYFNPFMA
ncbi:MAG: energy-coupling factor transporter transmembrane protein EcfT [Lachnospiraceae bacterium]|nr:energy-coupling factor transporter transmembrane protein EcfT [Lachnospiraceae bacterium]